MAEKPKILILDPRETGRCRPVDALAQDYEVVDTPSVHRALALLRHGDIEGVFVDTADFGLVEKGGLFLQADEILEAIADGVAIADTDRNIIWANPEMMTLAGSDQLGGKNFYRALGSPEIEGPDYCPFTTAIKAGLSASTVLHCQDNKYLRITVTPIRGKDYAISHVICLARDITAEIQQQQKIRAIHQAGTELADLTADELAGMDLDQRIELLKSNILRHTEELLNLDSLEIRLLDRTTKQLEPLLTAGMCPEAAAHVLYASPSGNGVTGFVAATGDSYLCEDTGNDPLYLLGAEEAKSSITVPLILHDEVIGTFNVESPKAGCFTEEDVQFLEIYARDVAVALNTLELLQAQKLTAASESIDLISSEVALPVDAILRDATSILEKYIGHEPELSERVRQIIANARDIKQVIQRVGDQIQPQHAVGTQVPQRPHNPILCNRRVLLVDNDEQVRLAAHSLLARYGCIVETASEGHECVTMSRLGQYDVCIADIRLADMGGYEIFKSLRSTQPSAAVILMTGFGYDAGHAIVKARGDGLHGVLYKPFRVDRLIAAIETAIQSAAKKKLPAGA